MTEEQFNKLYKLLESMDWKLWEIHNMIKDVVVPETESDTEDDN